MKQGKEYGQTIRKIFLTLATLIFSAGLSQTALPQFTDASRPDPGRKVKNIQKHKDTRLSVERMALSEGGALLIVGTGFGEFEPTDVSVVLVERNGQFQIIISRWLAFTDMLGNLMTTYAQQLADETGRKVYIVATGTRTGRSAKSNVMTEVAAGADIDQCANGGVGMAREQCIDAAWVNGNLNSNKAQYTEGQVVPFRMRFTGLSPGAHTVIVGYDTTENGKHAYDFLARFDYTESAADPCDAGTGCSGPESTWPIADDPNIPLGYPLNPPEFAPSERYFSMWGATITSVGTPVITSGDYSGSSRTEVTVTFNTSVADPVLAWGGHLARRGDWGNDASAAAIEGSPFHMRLIALDGSGGNQDRSIQSSAVIFPARVTIYKHASPPTLFEFGFTATNLPVTDFILVDDSLTTDAVRDFTDIQDFNLTRRITETSPDPFALVDIQCTVVDVEGITGSSATVVLPYVDVSSREASTVTCTFFNDFATAADVEVSGTVLDRSGRGLPNVYVSITDRDGNSRLVRTNPFGNYFFTGIESGRSYFVEAIHKQHRFAPLTITVNGSVSGIVLRPLDAGAEPR